MKTIHFHSRLNLNASGKARRFSILAYSGGSLRVDGFQYPVVIDLTGLEAAAAIPIILDHSPSTETTIGQTSQVVNDGRSLKLSGEVTGQSQRVREVIAQADSGYQWQASVGCSVEASQEIPEGSRVTVNGQTFVGPIIVARRTVLRETSVLPMGADSSTSVNLAAKAVALKGVSIMTFEEFVQSLGLEVAGLSPALVKLLQKEFDAQQAEPAATSPEASAAAILNLRAASSVELNRQSQILATCQGFPHISETAIRLGWSVVEAENHVLKAQARQMTPSNRPLRASGGLTKDALSASLLIRAGAENVALNTPINQRTRPGLLLSGFRHWFYSISTSLFFHGIFRDSPERYSPTLLTKFGRQYAFGRIPAD